MAGTRRAVTKKDEASKTPKLRHVDSILEELGQMHQAVMRRAHEMFDGRGRHDGRALDDWLDAEQELRWSPAIELTEKDGQLMLEAAVAGLEPEELEVQVTPEDVLIRSDRTHSDRGEDEEVYTCEFCPGKLFREVHLPALIEPKGARAAYHNGMLRITLPIAERSRPRRIEIAG